MVTLIANLVSGLFCISKDNCRSRKKVLIDRRARSTSPQGSRLVKSIPVKGVTFCCQTRKKKNISPFPHFKDYDAETQWSRIQKIHFSTFPFSTFFSGIQIRTYHFLLFKKRLWVQIRTWPFFVLLKKVVGSRPGIYIDKNLIRSGFKIKTYQFPINSLFLYLKCKQTATC